MTAMFAPVRFTRLLLKTAALVFLMAATGQAQYDVGFFVEKAKANSPRIHALRSQLEGNMLQWRRIEAENTSPQIYLSAAYLFAPYFNNGGNLVSSTPLPDAQGYDAGITNGGLYSAQLNLDKTIFNGTIIGALEQSIAADNAAAAHGISLEQRSIQKTVIDLYLPILQAQQLLEVDDTLQLRLQDQLVLSRELAAAGVIKQTDFMLIQIETQNQLMQKRQREADRATALNALFTYCGIGDSAGMIRLLPMIAEMRRDSGESAFLKSFQLDSIKSAADQDVFESKYAPQIKLLLNTGLNATELPNIERKFGVSAGINFSLPLYDGDQRHISRQQRELQFETIASERRYFAIQRQNQLKNLKEQILLQKKNIALIEKQLGEYAGVLDISAGSLRRGNLSAVEYLAILKNVAEMQRSAITARITYCALVNTYNYWCW
ncbi:MAG: TolC family protein [Ignavibacteriales bacterium]|nr:TolC family protein [Ignavibacteriales bacterium]